MTATDADVLSGGCGGMEGGLVQNRSGSTELAVVRKFLRLSNIANGFGDMLLRGPVFRARTGVVAVELCNSIGEPTTTTIWQLTTAGVRTTA